MAFNIGIILIVILSYILGVRRGLYIAKEEFEKEFKPFDYVPKHDGD